MAAFPCYTSIVLLWLLLCTTITLNSVTGNTNIHCNKQDMNALLNFKQGVTDPSGLLSSWSPENGCCQWTGVHCDSITGRVTEVSLPCDAIPRAYGEEYDKSRCLTGEFHLSLLDLEYLSYLDLSYNDFRAIQFTCSSMFNTTCNDLSRGTPPHQWGNSSNLHYLDLSYNDDLVIDNLSWIPRLFSLQYLNLSGIDLHKETDWLHTVTMLPSLSELHMESCKLQNIYPSLQYANFTSLDVLDLDDNGFISELPNWIFNLSRGISVINLAHSHIHGQLPKTLPNLRSIKSLSLKGNNLDGPIPDWLGQLKQLQALDLSRNSFSGPIPTSLGNLSALTRLNLMSNNLSGTLPTSLGKHHNLEAFLVLDNFFSGNISERNFHSLTNLKYLTLGSPALLFDFDPEWIPPFQLITIEFDYVVPKLPSWLYTQSSLENLVICHSRVSFEPLDKFWKFAAQLEFFSLTNNSVDADMSNVLLNSKVVWLDDNKLRGGVPQISPNVAILELSENSLTGSISPLLCHKMKEKNSLEFLRISINSLSGEIPNCWMNWKSLLCVALGDNNLTGNIPHSMGSLSNLISLDLSNNKLSGEVSLALQNCQNLWILNLAENMFFGAISSWMSPNLKALQLRSNQFSGNISTGICQLHSLKILDFANNRLSGSIPNCLHSMTSMVSGNASLDEFVIRHTLYSMEYRFNLLLEIKGLKLYYGNSMYAMDLSSNSLSGTLPLELFRLIRLQSLNLSYNQLEGMIRPEIGNLKQLESLDLSCNRLIGQIPQSMSDMFFLEVLNLSFNNFMGEIPSGTQLQGFTNLSYMGNPKLCGSPLTNNCTQDGKVNNMNPMAEDKDDEEFEVHSWFYMGLGIGFATGFCGVLGVIFFNKRCRHAYFRFLSLLCDMVLLKMNIAYWSFRNCYSRN